FELIQLLEDAGVPLLAVDDAVHVPGDHGRAVLARLVLVTGAVRVGTRVPPGLHRLVDGRGLQAGWLADAVLVGQPEGDQRRPDADLGDADRRRVDDPVAVQFGVVFE